MRGFAGLTLVLAGGVAILLKWKKRLLGRKRLRVIGVIPARFQSARFPGKPLVSILGKPMVVHTWEQACKATTLQKVVVATDDERIASACRKAGAEVVMTSSECPNGTVRCHEAVTKLPGDYDVVINIQGDEPLIEPEIIDDTVRALQNSPDCVYSTACTPLDHERVEQRTRVKCILDRHGHAIYFSRGVLPANKDGAVRPFPAPFQQQPYLLHLGLACFDRAFLAEYCRMAPTPLMLMEDLEQLKVLENGYKIKVIVVEHNAHGVDEPEDVAVIEQKMREEGLT
ncbi:g11536 [Coccomyxa elongata]